MKKSVGRNATLILGLTPDPNGLIPTGDEQRLKEFGTEINRRFSSPLAQTSGQKKSLTLKLDKKQPVNYCIIQENIQNGERIRQYKSRSQGKWKVANSLFRRICRTQTHRKIRSGRSYGITADRTAIHCITRYYKFQCFFCQLIHTHEKIFHHKFAYFGKYGRSFDGCICPKFFYLRKR